MKSGTTKKVKSANIQIKAYPQRLANGILMPEKLKMADNILKKVKNLRSINLENGNS